MAGFGHADGEIILKADYMLKRSLLKTWHARENYKNRWIVLTSNYLKYCAGTPETGIQKEKGRIMLSTIRVVEFVEDEALGMPNTFQIEYQENGISLCLYVIANFAQQRDQWVDQIKEAATGAGARLSKRYHPGAWITKTGAFSCCDNQSRNSRGCQTTATSEHSNAARRNSELIRAYNERRDRSKRVGRRTPPPTPNRQERTQSQHSAGSGSDGETQSTFYVSNIMDMIDEMSVHDHCQTSNSSRSQSPTTTGQWVVALYNYGKVEDSDLDLVKGQEYEVLDESSPHWWKVRNLRGDIGHVPVNFTRMISLDGLERYAWYYSEITRPQCERLLHKEAREGCFLVRKSSQTHMYTLSVYTADSKHQHGIIKHYYIRQDEEGKYYLKESQKYSTIQQLITFHKNNSSGLTTKLRGPPAQENDHRHGEEQFLRAGRWRIEEDELSIERFIGKGDFSTVHMGRWNNQIDVAIKVLKEDAMTKEDFLQEGETMSLLQHPNLVQLYGICDSFQGLYIVTEYMPLGDLLSYLVKHRHELVRDRYRTLDMVIQVAWGMQYLENQGFIHRDLAARNCLVGDANKIKIADFGLARFVKDEIYTSSSKTRFPVRWAAIEVLRELKFSNKSDVWSFGILMWEILTGGMVPYGRSMKNVDVYNMVTLRNQRLDKPATCSQAMYSLISCCWLERPSDRPSFAELVKNLEQMQEDVP